MPGSDIPQGWDDRISDGGELTYTHSLSVHQVLLRHKGGHAHDLRGGLEAGAGYTTDVRASLSGRWGWLNTPGGVSSHIRTNTSTWDRSSATAP